MQFACRIYKNTGFNRENRPYSPSVLNGLNNYIDVPPLLLFQDAFLSQITVNATYAQVADADYCKVGSCYYVVHGVTMVAEDSASLSISMDGLCTAGGSEAITVIGGVTSRYSEVSVGEGDDPMLAPTNTMDIDGGWIHKDTTCQELIECTLDPFKTALATGEGRTYTESATGESVTVPKAVSAAGILTKFIDVANHQTYTGTSLVKATGADAREALAGLRSLGLEGSVISHIQMPTTKLSIGIGQEAYNKDGSSTASYGEYAAYVEGTDTIVTTLPITANIAGNASNAAHINNSDYAKVGLLSCDGSSVEFKPSEVDIADGVRCVTDPHPDGRPFFRFKTYKNDSSLAGFWRNAIAGMRWKQLPLVFNGASGSEISRIKTDNVLRNNEYDRVKNQVTNAVDTAANGLSALGNAPINPMGATMGAAGAAMQGVNNAVWIQGDAHMKNRNAILDYGLQNSVALPQLSFPFQAETLRDVNGNGVYCYRYKYTAADLSRIDKLITRYGKKYTAALTREMLIPPNNKNFIFIQCSDVSVTHYSTSFRGMNWINNLIADELRGGVRLWRTAPTGGTI